MNTPTAPATIKFDTQYFSLLTGRRCPDGYSFLSVSDLIDRYARLPEVANTYLQFLEQLDPGVLTEGTPEYINPEAILAVRGENGTATHIFSVSLVQHPEIPGTIAMRVGNDGFIPVFQSATGLRVGDNEADLTSSVALRPTGEIKIPMFSFYDPSGNEYPVEFKAQDRDLTYQSVKQALRQGSPLGELLALPTSGGGGGKTQKLIGLVFDPEKPQQCALGRGVEFKVAGVEELFEEDATKLQPGMSPYSYVVQLDPEWLPDSMELPDGTDISGTTKFYLTGMAKNFVAQNFDYLSDLLQRGGDATLKIDGYRKAGRGYVVESVFFDEAPLGQPPVRSEALATFEE